VTGEEKKTWMNSGMEPFFETPPHVVAVAAVAVVVVSI